MSDSSAILMKWMSVTDANSAGHVHGGTVMRLCDEAAGLAATRHAHQLIVTAAVDRMTFLHPVEVGEVLTLRASVNAVWHTSMEVGVRVEAENPLAGETHHTGSAYLTMVAIDKHGKPCAVPPFATGSPAGRRREREAQLRRANRLAEREQIIAERGDHSPRCGET
jgi:acyl-CoA hydrolase